MPSQPMAQSMWSRSSLLAPAQSIMAGPRPLTMRSEKEEFQISPVMSLVSRLGLEVKGPMGSPLG